MPSCALCTLLIQVFNRHAANLSVSDSVRKDQIWLQVVDVHLTGLGIPSNEDALAETLKVGTNLYKVERRVARVQNVDGLIAILARLTRARAQSARYGWRGDWN